MIPVNISASVKPPILLYVILLRVESSVVTFLLVATNLLVPKHDFFISTPRWHHFIVDQSSYIRLCVLCLLQINVILLSYHNVIHDVFSAGITKLGRQIIVGNVGTTLKMPSSTDRQRGRDSFRPNTANFRKQKRSCKDENETSEQNV